MKTIDTILNIAEEFQHEIDALWKDDKFSEIEVIKRGYGVHAEIIKNAILFVGINPSFTKNSEIGNYFINIHQDGTSVKTYPDGTFSKREKPYSYFKKFVEIIAKLKGSTDLPDLKWTHVDLLFHRETEQKIISVLRKDKKTRNGAAFINGQFEIAKKIIAKSEPKVIVVSNSKARDFLKNKEGKNNLGFDFKFDSKLGTEIIVNHPTLEGVPVFFTSMLTGQRALDLGSYERLIWHIKYVLEKRYSFEANFEHKLS